MTNLLATYLPRQRSTGVLPLSMDEWVQMFNYQSQLAIGAVQTTMRGHEEKLESTFTGLAAGAFKGNAVIFACMAVRQLLFSEARFQWRQFSGGRPGPLFGTQELSVLENPWPQGRTSDLLTRMIQDVDLAGNSFHVRRPNKIRRLRPDWVTIVMGSAADPEVEADDIDAEIIGYLYQPGGPSGSKPVEKLLPSEVAHWAPYPDPTARFRGMPWLAPVIREVMADSAATTHKLKFFENAATPNLAISLNANIKPEVFKQWIEIFEAEHAGVLNAYKTLYLGGGADATVVGANLQQMEFKLTQGAGETRIAAAAGIPPVIVGLSEGLQAATYSNYSQARRRFADGTMRPLWRGAASTLEVLLTPPPGAELWYDDRDIPFLAEDLKDRAEVLRENADAINRLITAGFEPDAVVNAIEANDLSRLVGNHTGLFSVQLQPPSNGLITPPTQAPVPVPQAASNGNGHDLAKAIALIANAAHGG